MMADYSRDQLMQALRNADKAGDKKAATAIAHRIKAMDDQQPHSMMGDLWQATKNAAAGGMEFVAAIPDAATDAMAGAMRYGAQGVDAVGGAGFRAVGATGAADSLHRVVQMADKAWSAPAKIGNIGAMIAPEPADMTGKVARFGAGMIAGGALTSAAKKAPAAIRTILGAPPTPPMGPRNALLAAEQGATARTAAQNVIDAGKQAGVRVMTTDVKPPSTAMGKLTQNISEKIPIAGTGGVRAAQQGQRLDAIRTVLRDYGGEDVSTLFDDAPTAIHDVSAELSKQRGAMLDAFTRSKAAIKAKFGGSPVPAPLTSQAIDQQIARLQGINADKLAPVIRELEAFKANLASGKNLDQIEENRKILGAMFESPDLASVKDVGQKAINAIYDPLRSDITNFIRSKGGDQVAAKWTRANDSLSAMAGELKDKRFAKVLRTGELTPENVGNMLFSKNRSDVQRLYANLNDAGKARARAAVLQRAFDKSINSATGLSAETFVNNMKALGNSVGVVFEGADKARIEGLTRLLDATRRAAGASALPATGAQNTPILGGYALGTLFGKAALPAAAVGGVFARAYESATVRNLLVGLSKTQPGSKAEGAIMKRLMAPIAVIIERDGPSLAKPMNENTMPALAADPGAEQQQKQQASPQP